MTLKQYIVERKKIKKRIHKLYSINYRTLSKSFDHCTSTMANIKPITVWSLGGSPNPWKPILILEELGLPYEVKRVGAVEVKQEPYISLNPNGRVPAIEDPNTGITLWEVCGAKPP